MSEATIILPINQLATVAIEHWRLSTTLANLPSHAGPLVRHALRKIEEVLRSCELEARSLDNLPYDPGLSAKVIDTLADPALPKGASVIVETVSPLVLHKGAVLRPAEVVIATNDA